VGLLIQKTIDWRVDSGLTHSVDEKLSALRAVQQGYASITIIHLRNMQCTEVVNTCLGVSLVSDLMRHALIIILNVVAIVNTLVVGHPQAHEVVVAWEFRDKDWELMLEVYRWYGVIFEYKQFLLIVYRPLPAVEDRQPHANLSKGVTTVKGCADTALGQFFIEVNLITVDGWDIHFL
jgi:hypothetical protein